MDVVTLATERLELSPPRHDDAGAIVAACQDPGIQRYTPVPSPYRLKDAEGFIAKVAASWADGGEVVWAIRAGGEFAGVIGLHRLTQGSGEIGYWMAPAARGRGLLTEAAEAVIAWGFAEDGLGLQRIEWRAVVGNIPSARVARALGFRYEGLLRQALVSPRARDDGWIAGLLPADARTPQPWPML